MFTGIIEETGTVRSVTGGADGAVLDIGASRVLEGTREGDSIAVNGVCLTVSPGSGHFRASVMPETLRRTSLGSLRPGSKVNLERAMLCGGRFGGHIVTGHVDACGRVASVTADGIARLLKVSVPGSVLKYIAVKGSVTLDGTSLTVSGVDSDGLTVSLIPHTMASTTGIHDIGPASHRLSCQCGGGSACTLSRTASAGMRYRSGTVSRRSSGERAYP